MVGSATITAKTGPGGTMTAIPLTGVSSVEFDIARNVVVFKYLSELGPKVLEVDMSDLSTVTSTITEGLSLAVTVTNA